jgi:hypothetical protein
VILVLGSLVGDLPLLFAELLGLGFAAWLAREQPWPAGLLVLGTLVSMALRFVWELAMWFELWSQDVAFMVFQGVTSAISVGGALCFLAAALVGRATSPPMTVVRPQDSPKARFDTRRL